VPYGNCKDSPGILDYHRIHVNVYTIIQLYDTLGRLDTKETGVFRFRQNNIDRFHHSPFQPKTKKVRFPFPPKATKKSLETIGFNFQAILNICCGMCKRH
jgi:hypothetical protein